MGKGRVDPRKYGMSRGQVQGSWWFIVHCPDGSTNMCHYSPVTSIADVIRKSGGSPETHVAKYGSKTLDPDQCLEDYKINLNGSRTLGDYDWDGKLAEVTVSNKSAIGGLLRKFKKGGASGGGASESYEFVLQAAGGLVAADKSGTSDPYVVLSFEEGGSAKSSTKKKNLSPKWTDEALTLRGPSRDKAVLKVQVFDANVIQKDVLLGEAQFNIENLYKLVQYHTYSMRSFVVPLAPQGWVQLSWKHADQSVRNEVPDLILEPSFGFSTLELQNSFSDWRTIKTSAVKYHSSLLGVVQLLEYKLYGAKMEETKGSVLQVAAQFGPNDKWSDLQSRWTTELLKDVKIFVLEVKTGHTPAEVSALLEVVKNTPSITEVHLLDFDGSDAMEHGIQALKGASHITKLKYSDDQDEVNDDGATSLAELLVELPALQSLEVVPSKGMIKSQHFGKLLQTIAGLKIKSLVLSNLPSSSDQLDLSALLKTVEAESLALHFDYAFRFEDSPLWKSIISGIKESPVRRLGIEHRYLVEEPAKELVQAILQAPALEELRLAIKGKALPQTLPLLDSSKLKALSLAVDDEADAEPFLEKAAANTVLERLELDGDIKIGYSHSSVVKVAKENTTLKYLYLSASYSLSASYCSPSVLKEFASNTTLERAVLSLFKIYDSDFTKQVKDVAEAWEKRGAHFARNHEY